MTTFLHHQWDRLNVLGQFMGLEDHLTVTLGYRVLHYKHLSLS